MLMATCLKQEALGVIVHAHGVCVYPGSANLRIIETADAGSTDMGAQLYCLVLE